MFLFYQPEIQKAILLYGYLYGFGDFMGWYQEQFSFTAPNFLNCSSMYAA